MTQEYILNRVEPDLNSGCWIWGLAHFKNGYGAVSNMSERLAHRLSYRAFIGKIPDGLFVCHKCDTAPCVNPDHLFVGTHSENMLDMSSKGRHWLKKNPSRSHLAGNKMKRVSGERHHRASMDMKTAEMIRKKYAEGERILDLMAETGLKRMAVERAARGLTYKPETCE